jgi:hypothetical protein
MSICPPHVIARTLFLRLSGAGEAPALLHPRQRNCRRETDLP